MIERQEIIGYLKSNKERLKQKYHVIRIGIFGSYARNEQNEQSDIDIILEFEDNTDNLSQIKDEIRSEIQLQFQKPVDICREKYIKPIFKEQILSQAQYV
jgi:uncharacterized protein